MVAVITSENAYFNISVAGPDCEKAKFGTTFAIGELLGPGNQQTLN
jgi:hypothetical protein